MHICARMENCIYALCGSICYEVLAEARMRFRETSQQDLGRE